MHAVSEAATKSFCARFLAGEAAGKSEPAVECIDAVGLLLGGKQLFDPSLSKPMD